MYKDRNSLGFLKINPPRIRLQYHRNNKIPLPLTSAGSLRTEQAGRTLPWGGVGEPSGEVQSAARAPRKLSKHPSKPNRTDEHSREGEIGGMVVRRLGRAVLTLPNIRRRASNSWAAVRDTFFSTKVTT
jgi:hypothetical protein